MRSDPNLWPSQYHLDAMKHHGSLQRFLKEDTKIIKQERKKFVGYVKIENFVHQKT